MAQKTIKLSDIYANPVGGITQGSMPQPNATNPNVSFYIGDGGSGNSSRPTSDLSNGGGNGGYVPPAPKTPEIDPSAVYMDEIEAAAHDKNYKALLDADIAAYQLKMNTQKYLRNGLAAQGLDNQGYGTSAHVGVENTAANLYAQNLENFNQAESEEHTAAIGRQEAASTESDNQLVTFLQYSDGSSESIAGYMDKYGYVQGDDGNWYKKGDDGKADLSKPASNYVQAAVQSASENATSSSVDYSSNSDDSIVSGAQSFLQNYASKYSGVNSNGYGSVDDLRKVTVGNKDNGSTDSLNNIVKNELNYLEARINTGTIADGTLFKLQRGNGYGEAYLVLYLGGKLYIVSDDDREQEEYQVSSRYNAYQGPKEEIKGK